MFDFELNPAKAFEGLAKHLIQVNLAHRPKRANVVGSIQLWEKTGEFGTGEQSMFLCPVTGCKGYFARNSVFTDVERSYMLQIKNLLASDDALESEVKEHGFYLRKLQERQLLCSLCGKRVPAMGLADSYDFNMGLERVADTIDQFFYALLGDADVYLVHNKDLGSAIKAKDAQPVNGGNWMQLQKALDVVRDRRASFYSMKSIRADIANGASVRNRVLAMLRS